MADRLRRLTDEELGRVVGALPVAWPTADVAPAVASRVAGRRPRAAVITLPRSRTLRRAVLVAVAAVMLLGAAAVAGRLGVPGLRVVFGPAPTPTTIPVGRNLFLGTPTTLQEAQSRVAFHVATPHGEGLGPASVYAGTEPPGGRVSLVYPPRPGLRRSRFTDAGLLITEFRASVDRIFVKKVRFTGTRVVPVTINGAPGLWFEGAPHELFFIDRNGSAFPESTRLAGNTLVWSVGRVTIRLECRCGEGMALRIARSMR